MNGKAIILAGLMMPGLALAQALKPEDIYQRILPSVMTLQVENAQGEKYVGTAFFALGEGIAVTSWHVISDATKVSAKLSDNRVLDVSGLVDKDEKHDLALIRVTPIGGPRVLLCTANPAVGSRAYAIGAPKGFEFSITDGLISQIQNVDGYNQFQVSCPISGGNSGGPVVNERGEVVGVTSWTKRDAQNLSFAVPASLLAGLNPSLPAVPWSVVAKSSGVSFPSHEEITDPVRTGRANTSVGDLKQAFKNSAGKEVTVVILQGGEEKKFNLVVPKNFVR
ncbi:MAG: uncharacterized protein JWQ04_2713 [Pedosphaera sp.]|nr:uncharacterized protein [Pedosphaera sp.]